MKTLKGKKVLIFQQRLWGKAVGRLLARKLHSEGAQLAALTSKREIHQAIIEQSKSEFPYDLIINHDEILNNPRKFLGEDNFSLEEICRDLGIDSIWPLIVPLRLYVRSYKDKYYYSFRQNAPDDLIVDYVKAVYKTVKIFFSEFRPDVIVSQNFSSTHHMIFNLYAKKHGVPMFAFTHTKVQSLYIFVYDYNESTGDFCDRIDLLNSNIEQSKNIGKAKKYIQDFRRNLKKLDNPDYFPQKTLWQKIRGEIRPFRHIMLWYINRPQEHLKSVGVSTDYRPPIIILRDHYYRKKYKKFMEKFDYYPFSQIKKFVYFPLQFQPEEVIDVKAPFFSNQIETARLTAMSLPDDYTLVAKEHPAMVGIRSPSYIEKVARTPNVKLIDYRIPNEEIIKKTDLIISFNGSTIAEAAFLRVPTIQLGNLGITLKLPGVFKHTDMTTLGAKIKEILAMDLKTEANEAKLENYVAAAFDTGFHLDSSRVWEKDVIDSFSSAYLEEIKRII